MRYCVIIYVGHFGLPDSIQFLPNPCFILRNPCFLHQSPCSSYQNPHFYDNMYIFGFPSDGNVHDRVLVGRLWYLDNHCTRGYV